MAVNAKAVPPLTSVVIHACFDGNNGFSDWRSSASLLVKLFLKFGDGLRLVEFVCACVGVG